MLDKHALHVAVLLLQQGLGPGGPTNPFNFARTTARFQMVPKTGVTFADVAGVDEAKQDFMEVSGWEVWYGMVW